MFCRLPASDGRRGAARQRAAFEGGERAVPPALGTRRRGLFCRGRGFGFGGCALSGSLLCGRSLFGLFFCRGAAQRLLLFRLFAGGFGELGFAAGSLFGFALLPCQPLFLFEPLSSPGIFEIGKLFYDILHVPFGRGHFFCKLVEFTSRQNLSDFFDVYILICHNLIFYASGIYFIFFTRIGNDSLCQMLVFDSRNFAIGFIYGVFQPAVAYHERA